MVRFNQKLSQLECIYQIAPAVVEHADPIHISDYIHHMFENKCTYGIDFDELDKSWFIQFSKNNPIQAKRFISNTLSESGFIVSGKSIMEGIDTFNKGFTDD